MPPLDISDEQDSAMPTHQQAEPQSKNRAASNMEADMPATKVFRILKLLENILLYVPGHQIQVIKGVYRSSFDISNGSSVLQRRTNEPIRVLTLNKLLCYSKLPLILEPLEIRFSPSKNRMLVLSVDRVLAKKQGFLKHRNPQFKSVRGGSWTRMTLVLGDWDLMVQIPELSPKEENRPESLPREFWFECGALVGTWKAGGKVTLGEVVRECAERASQVWPVLMDALAELEVA